jgi:hypothetical protein
LYFEKRPTSGYISPKQPTQPLVLTKSDGFHELIGVSTFRAASGRRFRRFLFEIFFRADQGGDSGRVMAAPKVAEFTVACASWPWHIDSDALERAESRWEPANFVKEYLKEE